MIQNIYTNDNKKKPDLSNRDSELKQQSRHFRNEVNVLLFIVTSNTETLIVRARNISNDG